MSDHQWPEAMRKRARDEEDEGATNGLLGFTEHRNVSAVHRDMSSYHPRGVWMLRPVPQWQTINRKGRKEDGREGGPW